MRTESGETSVESRSFHSAVSGLSNEMDTDADGDSDSVSDAVAT